MENKHDAEENFVECGSTQEGALTGAVNEEGISIQEIEESVLTQNAPS